MKVFFFIEAVALVVWLILRLCNVISAPIFAAVNGFVTLTNLIIILVLLLKIKKHIK